MKLLPIFCVCVMLAVPSTAQSAQTLLMATTTSTQDSGLLEYLQPFFKAETGIDLKWVSVGTGRALEHGKNCDVDVLLVHAPAAEKKMLAEGHAVHRREVMYNDYVIVGPQADPAGVKGKTTAEALKTLATKQALFVSRGDNSGTHTAEKHLWQSQGMVMPDKERWYRASGQGMMPTLNMAAEKNAYTLTDRGTWIQFDALHKEHNPLTLVVQGDSSLFNQYSVMTANPAHCPNTKVTLAKTFTDWWVAPSTQQRIALFTLEGKQLFFPNAQ